MEEFGAEAGHEEGGGGGVGGNGGITPGAGPAGGFAPSPEVVGFAEPEAGLGLADVAVVVVVG